MHLAAGARRRERVGHGRDRLQFCDQLQEAPAEPRACGPALSRETQGRKPPVQIDPNRGVPGIAGERVRRTAEGPLERAGLLERVAQKTLELLDPDPAFARERLEAELVRRAADRQGGVGKLEQAQSVERIGEHRLNTPFHKIG